MFKVACYADLHGVVPDAVECDLAIIAGDVCPSLSPIGQFVWLNTKFREWITQFPRAVWIAGNHDTVCAQNPELIPVYNNGDFHNYFCESGNPYLLNSCNPYNDKFKNTAIAKTDVWGTPWSLPYGNYPFMGDEEFIERRLAHLPLINPHIIVSHGPPYGHGDVGARNENAGSKSLLKTIQKCRPKLVVYGHIHEGRGVYQEGNSLLINAAMAGSRVGRGLEHPPIVVEFDENYFVSGMRV